jgi:hypothetical protein
VTIIGLPGYANPNTDPAAPFPIDLGQRTGDRKRIEWTPLGAYKEASFQWHWYLPGAFYFDLQPDHRLIPYMRGLRHKAIHVRTAHNGLPFTGRLMAGNIAGRPGREKVRFSGVDYKILLTRWLAWVNTFFPPEIQIALTGKQDIMAGEPDFVFKYFGAKNWARLHRPIYSALPLHQLAGDLPDLADIATLDDLLNVGNSLIENFVILSARFTQGDELFKSTRDRLDIGYRMDLWDGTGTPPTCFNTESLSQLQSVIDATSDNFLNFLNPGNYLGLADPSAWGKADRACYIFDTRSKRDMRKIQWRTDGGQIESYEHDFTHNDATRAIVGGKAPEIMNQVIEWAANFAIQLLINALAPGLGLGFVVGDLFDDIFFAYQQFFNEEAEDAIGIDDAFGEVFADNTAAWSLDSYAIGHGALKEHDGSDALKLNVDTASKGYHFGADDGSGHRYDVGDTHTFYDRGTTAEQYISSVTVTDKRDGRKVETPTLGEDQRLRGGWERLIGNIQGLAGTSRAIANTV